MSRFARFKAAEAEEHLLLGGMEASSKNLETITAIGCPVLGQKWVHSKILQFETFLMKWPHKLLFLPPQLALKDIELNNCLRFDQSKINFISLKL